MSAASHPSRADVLACLDDAANEPAFRLAVAVLVIANDQNEWRKRVEERAAEKREGRDADAHGDM